MITKTIGPFHFEDLEPHRFEDLVRNLLYDFRDWASIEATGRAGSDDGYDARGWERIPESRLNSPIALDDSADESDPTPTATRAWMIQCKREKQLGPADVKRILKESITSENPPYGFLLAAPAVFSKKSYDMFASELRKLGVSEFYIWGRSEIEDMLLLPKNDRILFAFMGVSLLAKRRSRATDVRSKVLSKNRLLRALGDDAFTRDLHLSVLLRDINDEKYPFKDEVRDFDQRPAWAEHVAVHLQPHGIVFEVRRHFAYYDRQRNEFDVYGAVDLVMRMEEHRLESQKNDWEEERKHRDFEMAARAFYEHLPKRFRATAKVYGVIRYQDVLLVDDKGDGHYRCPHVYVDFGSGQSADGTSGPFSYLYNVIEPEVGSRIRLNRSDVKRARHFPEAIPARPIHRKIEDRELPFPQNLVWTLKQESSGYLYDQGETYGDLKPYDVIRLQNSKPNNHEKEWVEIIEVNTLPASKVIQLHSLHSLDQLNQASGLNLKATTLVRFIELRTIYEFAIKTEGSDQQ